MNANRIKGLTAEEVQNILGNGDIALAAKSNLSVMQCLSAENATIEAVVQERVKLRAEFPKAAHGEWHRQNPGADDDAGER